MTAERRQRPQQQRFQRFWEVALPALHQLWQDSVWEATTSGQAPLAPLPYPLRRGLSSSACALLECPALPDPSGLATRAMQEVLLRLAGALPELALPANFAQVLPGGAPATALLVPLVVVATAAAAV